MTANQASPLGVCLVPGTWGWTGTPAIGAWWWPGSAFVARLETRGFSLPSYTRPFTWSTDVNGIGSDHSDWRAGGEALYAYLVPPLCEDRRSSPDDTRLICHSHGGQVALYACAAGLKVRVLVTVATPVRRDMQAVITRALPQIGYWLHVYADGRSDWWQLAGALFDGRVGLYRQMADADQNLPVPGAGHSTVLTDPAYDTYWDTIADVLATA